MSELKVSVYESFDHLSPGYLQLFEKAGNRSIFHSLPWFKNYTTNVLRKDDGLRIYGVESTDGDRAPVAVLATQFRKSPSSLFRPRILSGLSNYYSSLLGLILDANSKITPAISEIAEELTRTIRLEGFHWDAIDLHPLDPNTSEFVELVRCFRSEGMIVQTYFCFGNWYLQIDGRSFQRYFESLPPLLKNTARRKSKKFDKLGSARVEIVTGGDSLEHAIQDYQKVYQSSWKSPEPYPQFVPGLIRTCAEHGWLRLGLAYVGPEPAAAQLWIVNGGVASIYKLAYDGRFSDLSVGTVLTLKLMEYVIDLDGVCEVDYLTGDDAYKRDWMSHRRERWGILVLNPRTIQGMLGIARNIWGRALRNAVRKALSRTLTGGTTPRPIRS